MSNFDSNTWFRISDPDDTLSLVGTYLFDKHDTVGTAFMRISDDDDPEQLWQIWTYNPSYFVMRTAASGPDGFLGSMVGTSIESSENTGDTIPYVANGETSDESAMWKINPWGDGTFFFFNAANGTDWHMFIQSNGLLSMTSNITESNSGQQFLFHEVKDIDDDDFSTLATPAAFTTPTATSKSKASKASNTSKPSSKPSNNAASTTPDSNAHLSPAAQTSASNDSSGMSTGAKAGIGVAIAVVVVALIAGAFLFWRRRRTRQLDTTDGPPPPNAPPRELPATQPMAQQPLSQPVGAYSQGGVDEYYAKAHAKHAAIAPPGPPPPQAPVELETPDIYRELPANSVAQKPPRPNR